MKIFKNFAPILVLGFFTHLLPMEVPLAEIPTDPIFTAIWLGSASLAHKLLESGVSPNTTTNFFEPRYRNMSPLFFAVKLKKYRIIDILAKAGADLNSCTFLQSGEPITPFYLAIMLNDFQAALLLLQAGIKIDGTIPPYRPNQIELPPWLYFAITNNKPNACKFLVAYGANICAKDILELSYFDWVAALNEPGCLKPIICHAFLLPESNLSAFSKATAKARSVLSYIPGLGALNSATPAKRIQTFLLCAKHTSLPKLPRDLQKRLLCEAFPDDIIFLMTNRLKRDQKVPLFAMPLMVDACYHTIFEKLEPLLKEADSKLDETSPYSLIKKSPHDRATLHQLLDPENFEENYGKELRANIHARITNKYEYFKSIIALSDDSGKKKKYDGESL